MPVSLSKQRAIAESRREQDEVSEHIAAMARCAAKFKPSARGNLWQKFGDVTATVYQRQFTDYFSWIIVDGDGNKSFSSENYDTEADALDWLIVELFRREIVN